MKLIVFLTIVFTIIYMTTDYFAFVQAGIMAFLTAVCLTATTRRL